MEEQFVSLGYVQLRFKGQFEDVQLGEFVAIAKPMAMRRYSVSSSPLAPGADPNVVTATVGQVKFTTGTGRRQCRSVDCDYSQSIPISYRYLIEYLNIISEYVLSDILII